MRTPAPEQPDAPVPDTPDAPEKPEPDPVPWHDPGPPVRKINLPPDSPTRGVPVESPERERVPGREEEREM